MEEVSIGVAYKVIVAYLSAIQCFLRQGRQLFLCDDCHIVRLFRFIQKATPYALSGRIVQDIEP